MLDQSNLILGIAASCIALIAGIYGFIEWIKKKRNKQNLPGQVICSEGNLFGVYPNGDLIQYTFESADSQPILDRKRAGVLFLRAQSAQGMGVEGKPITYSKFSLMTLDIKTLTIQTILDQKSSADGLNGAFDLLQPRHMKLSLNGKNIVMVIEKYVTASQLVEINLKSCRIKELFSAESFEYITSGRYKGQLLVEISQIRDRGRDIYYHVYNWQGQSLLRFDTEEDYWSFRSKALLKS